MFWTVFHSFSIGGTATASADILSEVVAVVVLAAVCLFLLMPSLSLLLFDLLLLGPTLEEFASIPEGEPTVACGDLPCLLVLWLPV